MRRFDAVNREIQCSRSQEKVLDRGRRMEDQETDDRYKKIPIFTDGDFP